MLRKMSRFIIVTGFLFSMLTAVWLHAAGSGTVYCYYALRPEACGCFSKITGQLCQGHRVSCNFSLFSSCTYYDCDGQCCKSGDDEGGGGGHDPLQ